MITVTVYVLDSPMWNIMLAALGGYVAIMLAAWILNHIPLLS